MLLHAAMLVWIAARHSPVVTELVQVPAGVSHHDLGHFSNYRVHPPLVRLLATLPVVWCEPKTDWAQLDTSPRGRTELAVGQDFLRVNGPNAWRYFFLARLMVIPFSLVGAEMVRRWSSELFGRRAGLLSQAAWCLGPSILGAAAFVTADVATATMAIVAAYSFRHWVLQPSWEYAIWTGIWLGAAQLTKTTLLIFYVLFPLMACAVWIARRAWNRGRIWQLPLIAVVSLVVLNAGYFFEHVGVPLGTVPFASRHLAARGPDAINRFSGTVWSNLPLPVPLNYVLGIDTQQGDFELTKRSYLGGTWRNGGWWYFYIYALIVKAPLGWLLIAAVSTAGIRASSIELAEKLLLWGPLCGLAVLVSSQTGFSIHYRYILPVVGLSVVWIGQAAMTHPRVAITLASWACASSLFVYPHSLSYFNELAFGPHGGSDHLVGSPVSWGQDLFYLRDWIRQKGLTDPVYVATLSYVDPRWAGVDFLPVPTCPREADIRDSVPPGWYVIDVNFLRETWEPAADGRGGGYLPSISGRSGFSPFARLAFQESIGYSMRVFRIGSEADKAPGRANFSQRTTVERNFGLLAQ